MNLSSRVRRRIVGLVAMVVAFGWNVPSVSAHASLVASDPAPSAIVESSPESIRLDFSEPVSPSSDAISLFDSSGAPIRGGSVAQGDSSSSIVMNDVPELDDGIHVLAWRVVSADGHLVQGAYTFTVGAATTGVDLGELVGGVLSGRSGASGVDVALVAVRWVSFLAAVVALGTLAFLVSSRIDRSRATAIVLSSSIVLSASSLVHFAVQGVYVASTDWSGLVDSDVWAEVYDTRLGTGLVVRLVLAMLLVALVFAIPHHDVERADRRLASSWWQSSAALIGVAILVTFSVGGHPSATPLAGISVAVDTLHLGAIALWIGGMFAVLVAGRQDRTTITRLSSTATFAAPITVLTGMWQTWRIGGGWGDLVDTEWGRGVLVKVALVVVLLALGAVARQVVRRSVDDEWDPRPIGRLMRIEVVIALGVLAASSFIVGESPVVARPPAVYSATLAQGSLIVDLTVTPGVVGNNEIHVVVTPPGGALERIPSIEMRATPPGDGAVPIAVAVLGAGPNHFVGRVAFVAAGDWMLEILVRPDPSSSVRLSDVIPIEDL